MHNVIQDLTNRFQAALKDAYPEIQEQLTDTPVEVVQSSQDKFGHYQFNSAMKLTKLLGQNPRQIAQNIASHLDQESLIAQIDIAGPGFINITIDADYISSALMAMYDSKTLGVEPPEHKERIIVEFSSPNTAKELHVGHLRSTIIGECLARCFEFLGHDVTRLNHIGDWGTAFGMLIAYLKEEHPLVLSGKEETDLSHLVNWYKASKKRFDDDAEFKKRSQLEVVSLQGGDPDSLKAWNTICDISRKAYQEIYDLLDVTITERGESFYNPQLPGLIDDLEQLGQIEESDGAKCIFFDQFKNRDGDPLPLMMQKSDGGYGYDTTDVAAMRQRVKEEHADRIIVITDAGQSQHFKMVYQASVRAGYLDPEKVRFDHVPFGLVLGSDGKKFRTRSGETEKLSDLLYNAIDRAKEIMEERNPAMESVERDSIAHELGLGAVKYADLSSNRVSDYTFSYDRMLRFEGNTAAFLMYVYVRVAGIKRKIGVDIDQIRKESTIALKHPSEVALGMHLIQFVEALDQVTEDLLPNRLADYLYGLADKFNAFYRDCQVEGAHEMGSRLLLCELVARTMKKGLWLLGVNVVERM